MKLPTFSSSDFSWRSGEGTSALGRLGLSAFPEQGFYIKSARTGVTCLFLPDSQDMEANEFYDGEASSYFSPSHNAVVYIWVGDSV